MGSIEAYAFDVVHAFLFHETKDVFYSYSDATDFFVCLLFGLAKWGASLAFFHEKFFAFALV
jgi:hypothetical protein